MSARGFSGSLRFAFNALESELSGLQRFSFDGPLVLVRAAGRIVGLFGGNGRSLLWHPWFGRVVGWLAGFVVAIKRPDVILAVAASRYVAFLSTQRPIVYCSDATFRAAARLYPEFADIPSWATRGGELFERRTLAKATASVFSSEWARVSAVDDYSVEPELTYFFPFGANIANDYLPIAYLPPIQLATCRLLHVGMDWSRKGGDFAIEVLKQLKSRGVDATLDVVGRAPVAISRTESVTYHGVLNKDRPGHTEQLVAIYRQSHFLVLPTIAEMCAIVFGEAAAFSVPSLTFDVGGTRSAISHGRSGVLFTRESVPADFASTIAALWHDQAAYLEMRRGAWLHYSDGANWQAWARSTAKLIVEIAATRGAPRRRTNTTDPASTGFASGGSRPAT